MTGPVPDFYAELLRAEDPSRVAGWEHRLGQAARFEAALAPVVAGDTVLDVGCGPGSLYGYLVEARPGASYVGVDVLPPMVERARERFPEGDFRVGDALDTAPLPEADVAVAVGSLVDGRALSDPAVRVKRLLRLASRALRAARRCAVVVALDQDHVEGRIMLRAEEALGGFREAEIARVARRLGVHYEVHRVLTSDLAATLWRPEARRLPVAGDYAARALAGPLGRGAKAEDVAWLWYAAGQREAAAAALDGAPDSWRVRWLREALAGMA